MASAVDGPAEVSDGLSFFISPFLIIGHAYGARFNDALQTLRAWRATQRHETFRASAARGPSAML